MKEKDEKKGIQAKKNVPDRLTDEKKRRGRKFFGRLVVAFPNQNPQSAFALAAVALLHRFFSSFFASSFFFLQKEYSFVALLVGRARACIYLETRDLDASFSRDETRKRERRKENVNERKRERKRDFPLLFKRFIKGALRAEFSLTLSLSLPPVLVCDSSSEYTFLRNTQTRTKTKAKCVLLLLPRRRRSHREEEE